MNAHRHLLAIMNSVLALISARGFLIFSLMAVIMTREQSNILWVGLFLVVAYVFTDIRVRNLIFGRESVAHPAETASFTLYNVGSPSTTGNGQSNTGNSPTINGVASPTVGGTATPVPKTSSGGTVLL